MSKPADTWMPLYIGDYLADTMHLTHTQHGIYILLIMAYWRSGGPLTDDEQLAAVAKCSPAEWRKHRPVIAKFFHVEANRWTHKRIDAELDAAAKITQERSKAGANGAAKRWQKPMANASQIDAPSPSPSPSPSPKGEARELNLNNNLTFVPIAARANSEEEGNFKKFEGCSSGRSAPLLAHTKRDQLVQKLMRFSHATFAEPELSSAITGLCGGDTTHNEQWWLDHLDKLMKAQHWDDARISA